MPTHRALLGSLLAFIFIGLSSTGVWLFLDASNAEVIVLHVLFAFLFLLAAIWHIRNNLQILRKYLLKHWLFLLIFLTLALTIGGMQGGEVVEVYAKFQQLSKSSLTDQSTVYQLSDDSNISIELRAGKHFWFPQIAIWTTDTRDKYLETLFVTHSTAKGEFYGGRTKHNFKSFDQDGENKFEIRRVDALPYWSEKRGVLAVDGRYAPTQDSPLPDGISGATPDGNIRLNARSNLNQPFKIWVELNVAFDDNKYYSQYDMPEDSLYHSGTGLLGQPSVVYVATVDPEQLQKHYILEYAGHTHPSKYQPLTEATAGLTTALEILDLGIVSLEHF